MISRILAPAWIHIKPLSSLLPSWGLANRIFFKFLNFLFSVFSVFKFFAFGLPRWILLISKDTEQKMGVILRGLADIGLR